MTRAMVFFLTNPVRDLEYLVMVCYGRVPVARRDACSCNVVGGGARAKDLRLGAGSGDIYRFRVSFEAPIRPFS